MRRGVWLVLVATALALAWGQRPAWGGAAEADSTVAGPQAAISDSVSVDPVDAFWRTLDPPWYEPLTVRDLDFGLSDAGLDSLVGEGDHVIARMIAGRPWQIKTKPLERFRYNRVEGLVLGGEVTLARAGVRQPSLTSGLDYGFAWRRCTHEHRLDVPLLTARPRDDEGFLVREPWVRLAFEAEGGRTIERFGGDRRPLNDLSALIAGDDPSQYYEQEAWRVGGRYAPHPALVVRVGAGSGVHRGLGARTGWSLFGDRELGRGNEGVPGLRRRSLFVEVGWRYKGLEVTAERGWHRVTGASVSELVTDSDAALWFARTRLAGKWQTQDRHGNTWIVRGEWSGIDRQGVPEWRTSLGGYGLMRGLKAGSIKGDNAVWYCAELRVNWDFITKIEIPILSSVQPMILFSGCLANSYLGRYHYGATMKQYNLAAIGITKSTLAFSQKNSIQLLIGYDVKSSPSSHNIRIILTFEP